MDHAGPRPIRDCATQHSSSCSLCGTEITAPTCSTLAAPSCSSGSYFKDFYTEAQAAQVACRNSVTMPRFKAGLGKALMIALILLNLPCAIIILGLAGRVLDRSISADTGALAGFQGNGATPYLVQFSLIAGAVAIASYITATHHVRAWESDSGAAAHATGWIAWLLLVITFCLAWKEIHIGGRAIKLRVLEAFIIMLTFTHFLYNLVLHIGDYGESADGSGKYRNRRPLNPNAPANNRDPPPAGPTDGGI